MEFRKIDLSNVWAIARLKVKESQRDFVSSNIVSIAEAYAARESGVVALPFGIYEADMPVGFIMFGYDTSGEEDEPDCARGAYCVWRLMIDEKYQGRGLGKMAMSKALEYLRTEPCGPSESCWISYEPDNIAAKTLYAQFGFQENGQMSGEETVAVLKL